MQEVATFPRPEEYMKASSRLDNLSLPYRVISPEPGYRYVGTSVIVMSTEARMQFAVKGNIDSVCSGWVEFRSSRLEIPGAEPPIFNEDIFGRAAIMVLASCVADESKIRIIAHISGDLTEVFPYLNAEMKEGCYNANAPTFTFMEGYRMVSLYPSRIAIAKADEIVDAWRTLEMIRVRVNEVWEKRTEIEPCFEMRARPPILEIYKRLPRTNCKICGEATCLAFAAKVYDGALDVSRCEPVFKGDFSHLKDALEEVCRGIVQVQY